MILCYCVVCVTFRLYSPQCNYYDLLIIYMNINLGVPSWYGDGNSMMRIQLNSTQFKLSNAYT